MCTVLLSPRVNPITFNKYIIYRIISHHITLWFTRLLLTIRVSGTYVLPKLAYTCISKEFAA
jgi:hypothetical protein